MCFVCLRARNFYVLCRRRCWCSLVQRGLSAAGWYSLSIFAPRFLSLSLSLSFSLSLSISLSQKEFLYVFPATKHTQKVEKNSERETQLHAHVGTNYMPQVTTRTRWPPTPCRLTLRRPAPRRLRTSARGVRRTRTPPSWTRSVRSTRRSTGALRRSYPSIAGDLAVELFALTNATRSWISRLSYYG